MKYRYIFSLLLSAVILCGCETGESKETEAAETTSETSATTLNEYFLVRRWDTNELLSSIFFYGAYHQLPMSPDDYSDFILVGDVMTFPDGSSVQVTFDEAQNIVGLFFTSDTVPSDFSILGADFTIEPYDIPEKFGFATNIYGSEDALMTFEFTGGDITSLVFEFDEQVLTSVYIHS